MMIEEATGSLEMKNPDGQIQEVERLELDTSRRMLGVSQCLKGTNDAEKGQLEGVAKECKEEVSMGKLDRKDAWSDFNSGVNKTLEYPFLVMTFTQDEYRQIMQPIVERVILPVGSAETWTEIVFLLW